MRFDVCAHTYDEHAGPQRFFAERVAQFIFEGRNGQLDLPHSGLVQNASAARDRQDVCPTTVLELGAGTGALTRWLAGTTILATDASPSMVERGRLAVPEAQWSVLDAFNERLPSAVLQVSSGLLHWAEDPVAVLSRWKTHLTPNGRMVHALPCDPCLAEWRAFVPESPVRWRSEAEWREIFQRAGLRVARAQRWSHAAVCASALEMVRGFHRTGVTGGASIGPARLRQALREFDAKQRGTGGVQATWVWLAVEASQQNRESP